MTRQTLLDLVSGALDTRYFCAQGDQPASVSADVHLTEDARLIVATGENASGKTFFGRVLAGYTQAKGIETVRLSMEFRTTGGIARALVQGGSEDEDSTGALSARMVVGALRNSARKEAPHLLILDEPDIGLSPSYAHAMGQRLHAFLQDPPDTLVGLVVITHSLPLMQGLLQTEPPPAHGWLRFGDDDLSPADVLGGAFPTRGPDALEDLVATGRERRRAIGRDIEAARKARAQRTD